MSISAANTSYSSSSLQLLELLSTLRNTGSTSSATNTTSIADTADKVDSAPDSGMAQMFSKLEDLATSDPDKFKELTAKIAKELKDAAGVTTGKDAEMLNKMADSFEKASESGNADDLRPQGPPPGHPPSGFAAAYSGMSDDSSSSLISALSSTSRSFQGPSDLVESLFESIQQEVGNA
jgi:hypothetical protein